MGELKPCPFCGGAAELHHYAADEYERWFAKCGSCGAVNGEAEAESEPDHDFAVDSWNRRTHPQPVTPAGGEVAAWMDSLLGDVSLPSEHSGDPAGNGYIPLYRHPPVADAALAPARKELELCETVLGPERTNWHRAARALDELVAALNQRGGG